LRPSHSQYEPQDQSPIALESDADLPRKLLFETLAAAGVSQVSALNGVEVLKLPGSLTDREWEILVQRIKSKACTPFLGAGAAYGVLPLGADIAHDWAQKYEYPLEDSSNLIAVAQFVALTIDPMTPKEEIVRMFKANRNVPDFSDPTEPHRALADLPIPVYITTNYDDFMKQALVMRDKDARQELCRWNRVVRDNPSSFDEGYVPTVASPVVFHLHGYNPIAESLVLTEDDYMDFLVNISRNDQLLPAPIQKALTGSSLLFIGYRIADWNFRVLLRSLAGFLESGLKRTHFAVIPPPPGAEAMEQKAQDYLSQYYENIDVRVYWGTARQFTEELQRRMDGS
jgi:hypothetical protein